MLDGTTTSLTFTPSLRRAYGKRSKAESKTMFSEILVHVNHLRRAQPSSSITIINRASLRRRNAERREAHKAMGR